MSRRAILVVVVALPPACMPACVAACVAACIAAGCAGAAGEGEHDGGSPGEGEGDGSPALASDPASCAFGRVVVGADATCALSLRNRGTAPAQIAAAHVDDASAAWFAVQGTLPTTVLPGGVAVVHFDVVAHATASGARDGTATFVDDSGAPLLAVPLHVDAVDAPRAVITTRVDGVAALPGSGDDVAHALHAFVNDVVSFDADASSAGAATGTITAHQFTLAGAGGSVAGLEALSADAQGVVDSAPRIVNAVPGAITVTLAVVDDAGTAASSAVHVVFDDHLVVVLDVASVIAGFTAHVFPASAGPCGALDCFDDASCGLFAAAPVDWDGAAGRSNSDPLFDPARGVAVALPLDGDVVVAVAASADVGAGGTGSASAVLHIVVDDVAHDFTRTLSAGDLWTVATASFSAGSGGIAAIDTVAAGGACP